MARTAAARDRPDAARARDRLIVALDLPDFDQARRLVDRLGEEVSFYKVGWHLFAKGLFDFVGELVAREKRVFLDFKSVDIGETVKGAMARFSQLGVEFVTIMGTATIAAAREGRQGGRPKILVVTLLTDRSNEEMQREYNTSETVEEFVAARAALAAAASADGVIASAREAAAIRRAVPGSDFVVVTPGIRTAGTAADDQKRAATPSAAIAAGADYLVVGRPIVKTADELAAARRILDEMQAAIDGRS